MPALLGLIGVAVALFLERAGIDVPFLTVPKIREGAGLALVPPVVVKGELERGALAELYRFKDLTEDFYAITPSRRYPNELVGELLQQWKK